MKITTYASVHDKSATRHCNCILSTSHIAWFKIHLIAVICICTEYGKRPFNYYQLLQTSTTAVSKTFSHYPRRRLGRSVASECMYVCLFVCPCSKRKTAWAIHTKPGTHILYSRRSACNDAHLKRSKVKVTGVSSAPGVGTHVDSTADVF